MLTIYHNPRCRKSRETLNIIEDSGAMVEVVEYLKTPPAKGDLKRIVEKLGIKPEDLIRKGETVYKEKYKGKSLTDDEWIDAMEENPILIERPIVVKGDTAVIGRPPENVKDLL
ncbi:arsenate reductase (glutaredoxin) [Fulvivirga ulvae]|uniref:arsenate reductase (glutaredoxin) n=1 Tax=Fulvivirga ulvae TaxID=2904245 RepID=UPI001EE9EDB9|nr:arsenate reductase (glutaredoxin) [Fulvivirga ulvae]UII32007.1 arsenate reductase (glutaredoxin) [Fulvivirga ulvae]